MRISDWSSDVCSSDLLWRPSGAGRGRHRDAEDLRGAGHRLACSRRGTALPGRAAAFRRSPAGRRGDRKSVVSGKSVSVRVDLGGRSSLKKKKTIELIYSNHNMSQKQTSKRRQK